MLTPKERGGGGVPVYPVEIANSVLFPGTTSNLAYTPTNTGDYRKGTLIVWYKGTTTDDIVFLHSEKVGSAFSTIKIASGTQLWFQIVGASGAVAGAGYADIGAQDPTSWKPLMISWDTEHATQANRVRMWQGLTELSVTQSTAIGQNTNTNFNTAGVAMYMSRRADDGRNVEGQFAEYIYIDGQQLTDPSIYCEQSDQVTGLVVPKEVVIPEYSFYSDNLFASASHSCSGTFRGTRNCTDAFDTAVDYNNTWLSDESGTPHWVTAELATAQVVTKYSLQCSDSYYTNESPRAWTFQGSNDNATWDDLDSQSGVSWNIAAETKEYEIANTVAYKYYRVYFTQNGVGNYTYVSIACVRGFTTETITWGTNGRHYKFDNAANLGEDSAWKSMKGVEVSPDPTFINDGWTGGWGGHDAMMPVGGKITLDGSQAADAAIWVYPSNTAGKRYLIVADVTSSAGSFRGDSSVMANYPHVGSGTFAWVTPVLSDAAWIGMYASNDFVGTINSLYIYECTDLLYGGSTGGKVNDATVNGSPVQTLDTPTNNYATLNSLENNGYNSLANLTEGNLKADSTIGSCNVCGTLPVYAGKFYFEATPTFTSGSAATYVGVSTIQQTTNHVVTETSGVGMAANALYLTGPAVPQFVSGTTLRFAVDTDANTIDVYDKESFVGKYTPDNLTLTDGWLPFVNLITSISAACTFNFGATGFTYTPPDGFKALCSANRPNPTVMKSASAAQVIMRVGTGIGSITNRFLGGSAVANSYWNTSTPTAAIDGVNGTYANAWYSTESGAANWLEVTPPTPFALNKYAIAHSDWGGGTGVTHNITAWTLKGWNGTSWDTLDTQSGQSAGPGRTEYTISNTTVYSKYRLDGMSSGTGQAIIGEFEGYDTNSDTKVPTSDMEGGPDWVNIKARDAATHWVVTDKLRGATKTIFTNLTNAEQTEPLALTAFNADGYSLGSWSNVNNLNTNYLDLALKAGVNNGFEIITTTGDDTYKAIPHNLGKTPTFIIGKVYGPTLPGSYYSWAVYHKDLPARHNLWLNATSAATDDNGVWGTQQNTMSATHFSVGQYMNQAGYNYVFYVFTDSDIFKAFSYTGNYNADGPFANLGGKVKSILCMKNADNASMPWMSFDAEREPFNPINLSLSPNNSNAETTTSFADFTSQGFKVTAAGNAVNGSGNLIVGLAILESTKYSNAF